MKSKIAKDVIAAIEQLTPEERGKLEQWLVDEALRQPEYPANLHAALNPTSAQDVLQVKDGGDLRPLRSTAELVGALLQSLQGRVADELRRRFSGKKQPETDRIIAECSTMGYKPYEIANALNANGHVNSDGKAWTRKAVQRRIDLLK